jgi:uncharacterized protein with HEPN domain
MAIAILSQMRDSARLAEAYAARGGSDWHHDELIVDAVASRVRQVAELAKYAFPEDERDQYPRVPWNELARVRDFYTHHYARLDPQRVRQTVEGPLLTLLAELDSLELPEFSDDPEQG